MTDKAIIQGEYHTIRHVPSRKVAQIIVEIPQERMAEWMDQFGSPGAQTQVAIARLADNASNANDNPKADAGRRNWHSMPYAQQAGIRCNEPVFQDFLNVESADDAAAEVRRRCGVSSRSEIKPETAAGRTWESLNADFQLYERSAA